MSIGIPGIGIGLTRNLLEAAVRALFASGEQGGWWDPSDFSTMFQDSAGTTPVTATGQPVGLIRDKSGRGNNRTQATAGSRPTLQQDGNGFYHLLYDGVDDFMQTASIDFSATNKLTAWTGINKASDSAVGAVIEGTAGLGIAIFAPGTAATANYSFRTFGGTAANTGASPSSFAAPVSNVLTMMIDHAGVASTDQLQARINGAASALSGTALTGTGNLPNQILFFGRRGGTTLPFSGREYQTIIRGAASTAAQIAQTERLVGSRMGISL